MCGAGGERQAERESCVCCLRLCLLLCLCLCLCCCLSLPKNNNVNYELMRLYMCVCVRLLPVCINILKRAVCLSIKSSNDDDGSMTHPFIAQQIQTVTHTHTYIHPCTSTALSPIRLQHYRQLRERVRAPANINSRQQQHHQSSKVSIFDSVRMCVCVREGESK